MHRAALLPLLVVLACRGAAPSAVPSDAHGEAGAIVVHGTARDAKGGAVLQDTEQGLLYVEGLDAWPAAWAGKRVVVSGHVVERQGPSCVHDPEPCQGIVGTYRVIQPASLALE